MARWKPLFKLIQPWGNIVYIRLDTIHNEGRLTKLLPIANGVDRSDDQDVRADLVLTVALNQRDYLESLTQPHRVRQHTAHAAFGRRFTSYTFLLVTTIILIVNLID